VEFMTRLQKQVPIVPILAKADTMTISERKRHLMSVRTVLVEGGIKTFDFKEVDEVDEGWVQKHKENEANWEAGSSSDDEQKPEEEAEVMDPRSAPRSVGSDHNSDDNNNQDGPPDNPHAPVPSRPTRLCNLFAVIADDKHSVRSYPWGDAGVYDKAHSDLPRLQELLFEQHQMQCLKDSTDGIYREAIRQRQQV
jgi:septin family protein